MHYEFRKLKRGALSLESAVKKPIYPRTNLDCVWSFLF